MEEIYTLFYFINRDSRLSDIEKDNLVDKQDDDEDEADD